MPPPDWIPIHTSLKTEKRKRKKQIERERVRVREHTAMGPQKTTVRAISQEAFDELVTENIDDLGMEPAEAVQDAIQTLTLQGVDLSGEVSF